MIVYRDILGRQRQYLHRIVHSRWTLWTDDAAQADRMSEHDAVQIVFILKQRSVGAPQHPATEPAGEYGTQEAV